MTTLDITFWLAAGCVAYTYLGYPLLLAAFARLYNKGVSQSVGGASSFSIVLAAHNEEGTIHRRLEELTALVAGSGLKGNVIVVSDGSTDATPMIARSFTKGPVHVLELPHNVGKAVALNVGCQSATGEIVVFADCRQSWSPSALKYLLQNFADPSVGAVSGDLVIHNKPGVLDGVNLYWNYEKWLRRAESRVHSTVGVTGAICAVRRQLFPMIPKGTILDDVYWPLQVVLKGFRVVHDSRAQAHDRLPERVREEFRRKVRTLCGNFQLLTLVPAAVVPWRNPIWIQYLSHKILRLLAPWALLAMLASSAMLMQQRVYQGVFWSQVGFYGLGLVGLVAAPAKRFRAASRAGSFLVLNSAAWLAFWVWMLGRTGLCWKKATYRDLPLGCSGNSS
jgi:cellulose synthase/poly-beta-1,6-N-acetylglucosamine synthase-like glycosyltransferase